MWEPSPEEVLLQNQMIYAMSCVLEAMRLQQQEHVPTFNYDDSNAAAYLQDANGEWMDCHGGGEEDCEEEGEERAQCLNFVLRG